MYIILVCVKFFEKAAPKKPLNVILTIISFAHIIYSTCSKGNEEKERKEKKKLNINNDEQLQQASSRDHDGDDNECL